MIFVDFQRTEFTGEKSELLQLPLLPGKGKREGKIRIPMKHTAVRNNLSAASGRQQSARDTLPPALGKKNTLKMDIFSCFFRVF